MRLPPTKDSDDHRVAVLREVWPEFAAYVRALLRDEQHLVEDFMHDAAADLTKHWNENGEVDRDEAAAILKHAARCDVINHWQSLSRRMTSPVAIEDDLLVTHADPNSEQDILAVLGRIDLDRLIQLLPRLLTERQRQVIVAVDVEGLTQTRAARQLGMTVRGLQKARDAALGRLRHYLLSQPTSLANRTPHRNREVPQ